MLIAQVKDFVALLNTLPFLQPAVTMQIMPIPVGIGAEPVVLLLEAEAVLIDPIAEGDQRKTSRLQRRRRVTHYRRPQQRELSLRCVSGEFQHAAAQRGNHQRDAAVIQTKQCHSAPWR
ncbi:hypothetical protein D3C76_1563370 [compost metagenome]